MAVFRRLFTLRPGLISEAATKWNAAAVVHAPEVLPVAGHGYVDEIRCELRLTLNAFGFRIPFTRDTVYGRLPTRSNAGQLHPDLIGVQDRKYLDARDQNGRPLVPPGIRLRVLWLRGEPV